MNDAELRSLRRLCSKDDLSESNVASLTVLGLAAVDEIQQLQLKLRTGRHMEPTENEPASCHRHRPDSKGAEDVRVADATLAHMVGMYDGEVGAALAELRERRAADLSAEDVEALAILADHVREALKRPDVVQREWKLQSLAALEKVFAQNVAVLSRLIAGAKP